MSLESTYKSEVSNLIYNIEEYLRDSLIDVVLYRKRETNESSEVFDEDLEPAFIRVKERLNPLEIDSPSVYTNPAELVFKRHNSNVHYYVYTFPQEGVFEVTYKYNMIQDVTLQLNMDSGDISEMSNSEKRNVLENSSIQMDTINKILKEKRSESLDSVYRKLEYHMTTHHNACKYMVSKTDTNEVSTMNSYSCMYFNDSYSLRELDSIIQQVVSAGRSFRHLLSKVYGLDTIRPELLEDDSQNRRYQY